MATWQQKTAQGGEHAYQNLTPPPAPVQPAPAPLPPPPLVPLESRPLAPQQQTPMSTSSGFNTGGVRLGAVNTSGMDPTFRERLMAMVAASGGRLSLASGFRSHDEQQKLWDRSDKTGKWVAKPGNSNHEKGIAADLGGDIQWAHDHASEFGLYFPMSWEPWHVEPVGSRGGKTADGMSWSGPKASVRGYTTPVAGYGLNPDPGAAEPRSGLGFQLANFASLINSPEFVMGGPAQLPSEFTSMPVGTA